LQALLEGIRKILKHKEIENSTVVMNDIAPNAFAVNADYFTGPLTYQEFIKVKEELNLSVLKLMEDLDIEIAGASTGVRIEGAMGETK
jgi:MscS family membrane protein